MENNTANSNPMLCKSNCGFFGNASCDGFCSKCYKDHVKRQNSGSAAGRVTPTGLHTPVVQSQAASDMIPVVQQQASAQEVAAQLHQAAAINIDSILNSQITMPPPQTDNNNKQSTSVPIPIPSRQARSDEATMSVPNDLISSSLLSASPLGAASMESNDLASTSVSSGMSAGGEKKKRNRCVLESCKRKVGLTGFDCRCGGLYCWEHRYSDKHSCQFDYKELGQDQIRKNNPILIGEKIQKI